MEQNFGKNKRQADVYTHRKCYQKNAGARWWQAAKIKGFTLSQEKNIQRKSNKEKKKKVKTRRQKAAKNKKEASAKKEEEAEEDEEVG